MGADHAHKRRVGSLPNVIVATIIFFSATITDIVYTCSPLTPCAENAKINVTNEPYSGTNVVCSYLPFSKAAKGAQGGPKQYATFERKHLPTEK